MKLSHEFVKSIPEKLDDGVVYVSIDYSTAIHRCCCGCGNEVVTPLSPTDWEVTFNGESISLYPSIGNWNFACQSHYWITDNKVEWAPKWTRKEIADGVKEDEHSKRMYYEKKRQKPRFPFFFKK